MGMPRHALVIEDDPAIRRGIVDALKFSGYETLEAATGDAGAELARTAECDIVLLDLILPGRLGLDILRLIREVRPTLPVIILTAKGEENDRIQGLRLGADDYMVKPFSVKELLARMEAVLRRSPERPGNAEKIKIEGGMIDLARQEVRFADEIRVELSEREVELLGYLARNRGRAISRDEILSQIGRAHV